MMKFQNALSKVMSTQKSGSILARPITAFS